MNNDAAMNIDAMQRADQAAVVRSFLDATVNQVILGNVHLMVAHYRGGSLSHDFLVGKVGEISALLGLLSATDGAMRAGDAARDEEFGNGTQTPKTPGTRARTKSS